MSAPLADRFAAAPRPSQRARALKKLETLLSAEDFAPARVAVEHLVTPATDTTGNPHHYVVVRVDGERMSLEVVGVGWGAAFSPYPGGKLVIVPEKQERGVR